MILKTFYFCNEIYGKIQNVTTAAQVYHLCNTVHLFYWTDVLMVSSLSVS